MKLRESNYLPRRSILSSAVALAILSLSAHADESSATDPTSAWQAQGVIKGMLGNQRNIGQLDLMLPFAKQADSFWFADVRGLADDNNYNEGNYGLGYRKMLSNGWNIGGYAYYDVRHTEADNTFHQVTLGGEYIGPEWEYRANLYLPELSGKAVGGSAGNANGGQAAIVGGTIVLLGTSTLLEERAQRGADFEVGWRIPSDKYDVRIYGGAYSFGGNGGPTIAGPRVRVESSWNDIIRPGWRASFGLEAQHDSPRGSQEFVTARLEIPLGKDAPRRSSLNLQSQRMLEPTVRDVDIITQKVTTITGTGVNENVMFDDPFNTGMTGQIAAAKVVNANDNLQLEIDNLGTNGVLVIDGSAGIVSLPQGVKVYGDQALMGGGSGLQVKGVNSGKVATFVAPGTRPTLKDASNSGFKIIDVTNQQNVLLRGMNFDANNGVSGGADGGLIKNSGFVTLDDLNMYNTTQDGWSIEQSNNIRLKDLTVDTTANFGYGVLVVNSSSVNSTNLTLRNTGNAGLGIGWLSASSFTGTSIDNASVNNPAGSAVSVNASNNVGIYNTSIHDANGSSALTVTASDNLQINGMTVTGASGANATGAVNLVDLTDVTNSIFNNYNLTTGFSAANGGIANTQLHVYGTSHGLQFNNWAMAAGTAAAPFNNGLLLDGRGGSLDNIAFSNSTISNSKLGVSLLNFVSNVTFSHDVINYAPSGIGVYMSSIVAAMNHIHFDTIAINGDPASISNGDTSIYFESGSGGIINNVDFTNVTTSAATNLYTPIFIQNNAHVDSIAGAITASGSPLSTCYIGVGSVATNSTLTVNGGLCP